MYSRVYPNDNNINRNNNNKYYNNIIITIIITIIGTITMSFRSKDLKRKEAKTTIECILSQMTNTRLNQ